MGARSYSGASDTIDPFRSVYGPGSEVFPSGVLGALLSTNLYTDLCVSTLQTQPPRTALAALARTIPYIVTALPNTRSISPY
jgi:hypothetical protein